MPPVPYELVVSESSNAPSCICSETRGETTSQLELSDDWSAGYYTIVPELDGDGSIYILDTVMVQEPVRPIWLVIVAYVGYQTSTTDVLNAMVRNKKTHLLLTTLVAWT